MFVGIERRQIVEENLFARLFGRLKVDGFDFDQREVTLALFRRTNLAADRVAGAQIELANLRWRDIDVVRAGQIVVLGRAQKTKTIRQGLQHTLGKDEPALFGLRGQNLENQFLLAHSGSAGDVHGLGDLGQRRDGHVFQRGEVKNLFFAIRARPGSGRSLSSGYAAAILALDHLANDGILCRHDVKGEMRYVND